MWPFSKKKEIDYCKFRCCGLCEEPTKTCEWRELSYDGFELEPACTRPNTRDRRMVDGFSPDKFTPDRKETTNEQDQAG